MERKYDKFLMSYVVAKRAKEMVEEGIRYYPKEQQNKNEILEAINEIEDEIITIEVNKDDVPVVKEEEDTLELLYSSIKKQKNETEENNEEVLEELLDVEEEIESPIWEDDEQSTEAETDAETDVDADVDGIDDTEEVENDNLEEDHLEKKD